MRVLVRVEVGTVALAEVGLVALGRNDEVPTVLVEVHLQGVLAAALLQDGAVRARRAGVESNGDKESGNVIIHCFF